MIVYFFRILRNPLSMATVVASLAAGCDPYPYGTRGYDYGPSFDRVPGYQPGYGPTGSAGSKYDYYRNYQGSFHKGPEQPQ